MRVSKIRISHILGIDELEIQPGAVTTVSGPNGTGKTSVLNAVRAVFDGGNDATLLRRGETEGEIVLVLDDETAITKRATDNGKTPLTVRGKHGAVSRPKSVLDSLIDPIAMNPIDFVAPPGKAPAEARRDRVRILLESFPRSLTAEEAATIAGDIGVDLTPFVGADARIALEEIEKTIGKLREGSRTRGTERAATAKEILGAVDTEILERDIGAEIELAKQEGERINAALSEALGDCDRARSEAVAAADEDRTACHARAREIEEQIAELQVELSAVKADARARYESAVHAADDRTRVAKAQIKSQFEGRNKAAAERSTSIADAKSAAERAKEQLRIASKLEAEAESERAKWRVLTGAIERVRAVRTEIAATLPLPDLAVVDGDVVWNGVPFDRLSTSEQIRVAFTVAMQQMKRSRLRLMLVDRAESLDSESLGELKRLVADHDVQAIISVVSNNGFRVDTE